MPYVFTLDEMVDFYREEDAQPDAETFGTALGRLGRNNGPALLADLYYEGLLTAEVVARHVGPVWGLAEYPDQLGHDVWRDLFTLAGFTINGVPAELPTQSLTLYRGSVPERRSDWSWTDRPEIALGYAQGTAARRPVTGTVWQATVEPWRLLCRNEDRSESEYVVDTEGLLIVAAHIIPGER